MASKAEHLAVWWILSVWILILSSSVNSANCPGLPIGPGLTGGSEFQTDNVNDAFFLISSSVVDCYGVVQSWEFKSASDLKPGGSCYTSVAQIWRPTPSYPSSNYKLVGENTLFDEAFCKANLDQNGNQNKLFPVNIPDNMQIPVQPFDVIAWHDIMGSNDRNRKISFAGGLPGSTPRVSILQSTVCTSVVGQTCPWQQATVDGRNYGIQAVLGIGPSPVFINLPKTISISELQPVGTFVYQVQASYAFTWNPTIPPELVYEITSSGCSSWFGIGSKNGSVSIANLIRITSTTSTCLIDIIVYPFGTLPPVFNTSTLTVDIINVDEPITITNLPSTIRYDVMGLPPPPPPPPPPQTIFTVTWSDPDSSFFPNARQFTIVSVEPMVQAAIFSIDPSTGVVSITTRLDDWTGPDVFKVNITASDGIFVDGPKTLTVILDNVIKPPVIQNLNATTFLSETAPIGYLVFTVKSLIDPLRSSSIKITYTITSQVPYSGVGNPPFGIKNIPVPPANSTQGEVKLNTTLNYLNVKQYRIEIQATQEYLSSTLLSEPRTLTVDVIWVDSSPQLTILPSSTEISEDTPTGTPVPGITITATDREYDNNLGDYLVFFVSDPHFVINNVTKTMYTAGSLFILPPAKCSQTYSLQVLVRDSYGKVDSSNLNVTVTRGNRESPKFSQTQYNGSVAENGDGGSPTGVQLSAIDPDCGKNGTITYSILGELANLYFQVDPASGVITQKQPISQPTYPNFTFTVVASDGGQPSLNSTALVFIAVNAVNAHAPWFAQEYMEIETRSDSPVGSPVYTLNVTDPDSASVNYISYQIVILQDDFDVRSSGDIVPKRKLSSYKRYTLYVMATDTGEGMNYFTDPATVAIDTYDAASQLVDIKMLRPLSETDPKLPEFMVKLNDFLKPWVVKLEDLKYIGDDTVVTIYAYDPVGTFSSEPTPKHFIDRDELLAKLRTDIYGTPVEGLRGPEFADYEIVSVQPSYPVWVLDTVEGIATLTVVCVVALALIIIAIVLLLKFFKLACFRQNKVAPTPEKSHSIKGVSDEGEFQLSYVNTEPYVAKTAEVTMSEVEPFERPPTYKANSPPLRPDADLEL